jgi:hypothetical protein
MSQKTDYVDETEIDASRDDLPADDTIDETVANLEANGFDVVVVDSAEDALETIQSHIPATASVIVSGVNKIVDDLEAALDRLESVAYPLENERAKDAYGVESAIAKQLIFRQELEDGRTTVVLVGEQLGY